MVRKECRKRTLFIIITIAVKVFDRSLGPASEETERVALVGRGEQNR